MTTWFNSLLGELSNFLYTYILIALLVVTGLYFTLRTKAVQFRLFPEAIRVLGEKKKDGKDISSFQALMISTASRRGHCHRHRHRRGRIRRGVLDVAAGTGGGGLRLYREHPGPVL